MTHLSELSFLLLLMTGVAAAGAEGVRFDVLSPADAVAPGATAGVDVLALNPGDKAARVDFPAEISATLRAGGDEGRSWPVHLAQPAAETAEIPAQGFRQRRYALVLPKEATGRMFLEIGAPFSARAVLEVNPAGRAPDHPAPQARESTRGVAPTEGAPPAVSLLKNYYAENFSVHEPIYFLYGSGTPSSKFQFSFKYRLPADEGPIARRLPFLRGLQFAYTQQSLWDIRADSSPFFDTSYMPEAMYELLAPAPGQDSGWFHWLGFQAGVKHESNGRGGNDSRALNIVYFRPSFAFGRLDGWHLVVAPRLFTYLSTDDPNSDIYRYRGYGELKAFFGHNNGLGLGFTGRIGNGWDRGSAQFDLTIPTNLFSGLFATYLHAQYWVGYGESLIRYNQHSSAVRFGISLVR